MSSILLHDKTKLQLENIYSSPRVSSIGIIGSEGSGKGYLAEHIAKKLLNIKDINLHPYVTYLNCAVSKVGIEEIRELKGFLKLKVASDEALNRCVIIENLNMLSIPAQNALLKTLEEPPSSSLIIVTTSSASDLLSTITSRIQWIICRPLSKDSFYTHFPDLSKKEVNKAYLLSDGYISKFLTIINDSDDAESDKIAIDQAKQVIKMDRFDKIAYIDKLIKNDQLDLKSFFFSLKKIIRTIITSPNKQNDTRLISKLDHIIEAEELLKYNLSAKLILTRLFNKL